MVPQINTIVHCHPKKKIVILTTLRSASSWCERTLTEEEGWLPKTLLNQIGLNTLVAHHEEGYKIYIVVKEPYLRLTSGMEIVVPPIRFPNLNEIDSLTNQEMFANSISLIVHHDGVQDIMEHGTLNYTCGDAHLSWGTHVTGMFLEAMGLRCTPVVLDSLAVLPQLHPEKPLMDFSSFVSTLNLTNQYKLQSTDLSSHKLALRTNRFAAWLQICSKVCSRNSNGFQSLMPPYTVYDWMNNDNYLYNTFLNLHTGNHKNRQQTSKQVLLQVINEMWNKLEIQGIAKALPWRQKYNRVYPWDTMFDHMKMFIEYETFFPEFYDREQSNNLFKGPKYYQVIAQPEPDVVPD